MGQTMQIALLQIVQLAVSGNTLGRCVSISSTVAHRALNNLCRCAWKCFCFAALGRYTGFMSMERLLNIGKPCRGKSSTLLYPTKGTYPRSIMSLLHAFTTNMCCTFLQKPARLHELAWYLQVFPLKYIRGTALEAYCTIYCLFTLGCPQHTLAQVYTGNIDR